MKRKRRTFTPEIKSKIALEAMKGETTINEIAQLYEVHPNQVSAWQGEMIANASTVFAPWQAHKRSSRAECSQRRQAIQENRRAEYGR
jgi:transposase-like protein